VAAHDLAAWLAPLLSREDQQARPVLFRLADDGDRARFEQLRSDLQHVQVCDRIREQIGGLVQSRTPGARLEPAQREEAVDAHLAGTPAHLYGVWAWYPWLRRLVHLLDRDEFVELRTDRNRNKITREERDRLAAKRVGVVGLSAGHAIALALALERGCGELRLADADSLDLSNLNRVRAGVHEIGLPKVVVASRAIAEVDPFLEVTCFPGGVQAGNVDAFLLGNGPLDLVFDECDSLDVKLLLRERAREAGIPVVMATGERGMLDVERYDLEPDRPLLHGLVGDLDSARLRRLTGPEKVPHVLTILGGQESLPRRARESLAEVGRTIETWPQLASAVILNSGAAADVSRRILLGGLRASGRHLVDLEALIPD
jgi:molybdopterin/thiamine biosynthesis adenylyltransferase